MRRIAFALAFWTAITCGIGALPSSVAAQSAEDLQVTPDWGDYPLLMSQFGELCTMCVAYLYCVPEESGTPDARYALYHFQTKDFWGQIATIWDYFAIWFDPVTSESRPAVIYDAMALNQAQTSAETIAYLDEAENRVEIGGTWIDRQTAAWFDETDQRIGTCIRPGIPEAMEFIEAQGPWQFVSNGAAP